ncbi:MAG: hypothetical protein IPF99_14800 [Deltaproteobacteria bacterium]|nr:hypothetical protein [Deltaproteobacteria bacterium]
MDREIDNLSRQPPAQHRAAIARASTTRCRRARLRRIFRVRAQVASILGDPTDIPFTLVSPIDRGIANVQGAVDGIVTGGGGDNPEAMIEALLPGALRRRGSSDLTPRARPVPGRLAVRPPPPNAKTIMALDADAPSHNGPLNRFNALDAGPAPPRHPAAPAVPFFATPRRPRLPRGPWSS